MGQQLSPAIVNSITPAITGAFGTGMKAAGQMDVGQAVRQTGEAQQRAAEYQAQQLTTNAGQAQAVAQRAAMEEIRKSMLLQSRAIAVSAASGGGALDPTVMALVSGLSKEGQLAAETQIYGGEERARSMREQAKATRYEGAQRAEAGRTYEKVSRMSAGTTLLSGALKDWSGYGFRGLEGTSPITESKTKYIRD